MSNHNNDTDLTYRLIYYIIPIPMILGVAFAAYVLITEDSRNQAFCTVAKQENAYQKIILIDQDFLSYQSMQLNECKDKDAEIDSGDGQTHGRVHWFVCKGTVCGKHWQQLLALPE